MVINSVFLRVLQNQNSGLFKVQLLIKLELSIKQAALLALPVSTKLCLFERLASHNLKIMPMMMTSHRFKR